MSDDKRVMTKSREGRELREELNERLHMAGLEIDEAGLIYLAYAPEIAGAMLRRQQALYQ